MARESNFLLFFSIFLDTPKPFVFFVLTGDLLDFSEQQNCGDSLQPTSNSPGRMSAIPGVQLHHQPDRVC